MSKIIVEKSKLDEVKYFNKEKLLKHSIEINDEPHLYGAVLKKNLTSEKSTKIF